MGISVFFQLYLSGDIRYNDMWQAFMKHALSDGKQVHQAYIHYTKES